MALIKYSPAIFWRVFGVGSLVGIFLILVCGRESKGTTAKALLELKLSKKYIWNNEDTSVMHSAQWHGTHGFGKRLREADILICGSSHTLSGLSSSMISEVLGQKMGKTIKVANLGLGFGESWKFPIEVIKRQQLKDKTIILDCFNADEGFTTNAKKVMEEDQFCAWYRLIKDEFNNYLQILCLDISVPQREFKIIDRKIILNIKRDWSSPVIILFDRETGDPPFTIVTQDGHDWFDTTNYVFGISLKNSKTLDMAKLIEHYHLRELAITHNLKFIFTMLPFRLSGDTTHEVINTQNIGWPYISISPEGLASFDGGPHLNKKSREITTHRLLQGLDQLTPKP